VCQLLGYPEDPVDRFLRVLQGYLELPGDLVHHRCLGCLALEVLELLELQQFLLGLKVQWDR